MIECKVEGCTKPKKCKGYCSTHYDHILYHGKILTNTLKQFNEIVDKGSYYEIILTDRKYNEKGRAKIDKEDLARVRAVGRWTLSDDGYVYNNTAKVLMHRFIMNAEAEVYIDHKKTGFKYKSDNRKKNLRECTQSQNCFNSEQQVNNTSGYRGVRLRKDNGKYAAAITINKKRIHLGLFSTAQEASKAYEKAAKKLQGEFFKKVA